MDRRSRSLVTRVGIGLAGLTTAAAVAVPLATSQPEEVRSRPASHVEPARQRATTVTSADTGVQLPPQQAATAPSTDSGAQPAQQAAIAPSADTGVKPAPRQAMTVTAPDTGCIRVDANGAPLVDSQYEQRTGHAPC